MALPRFDYAHALHQCAQGNATALQRLYEHESPRMLAHGFSVLNSRSEAEELVRETFILCWKNALGFDPQLGDGQAWVYSILRYRSQQRLKHRPPHRAPSHIPSNLSPNGEAPEFLRAVARLDASSQHALLMAYLQGSSYTEIGQRLDTSPSQVRLRLRAALGQLAQTISTWHGSILNEQQLLIAEYTLGLLQGNEQQNIQQLLQSNDQAAQESLRWEKELIQLNTTLLLDPPNEQLLWRIQTALGHETLPLGRAPEPYPQHPEFLPPLRKADAASSLSIPQADESPLNTSDTGATTADASPAPTTAPVNQDALVTPPAGAQAPASSTSRHHESAAPDSEKKPTGGFFKKWASKRTSTSTIALEKNEPSFGGNTPSETQSSAQSTPDVPHPTVSASTPATASSSHSTKNNTALPPRANSAASHPNSASAVAPSRPLTNAQHVPASEPAEPSALPPASTGNKSAFFWRLTALACAVVAVAFGAKIALTSPEPPINVIEVAPRQAAILLAPGESSTPGWLVTVDPEGNVLLNPQVTTDLNDDQSAQLWTADAQAQGLRSLGLINPNRPVALAADKIGAIETGQIFEITLEAKGGSSSGRPKGPILFIGRMVDFGEAPQPLADEQSL